MTSRMLLAAIALVFALGTGLAQEKAEDDAKRLQGSWDWDWTVKQSDAQPRVNLERIVILGNALTFEYSHDGKQFVVATEFKVNPKAMPKEIEFTPTGGPNAGLKYLGLYEIKEGQLRICYRGPGSSRPKNFNDKSDGNAVTTFIVLKPTPAR